MLYRITCEDTVHHHLPLVVVAVINLFNTTRQDGCKEYRKKQYQTADVFQLHFALGVSVTKGVSDLRT